MDTIEMNQPQDGFTASEEALHDEARQLAGGDILDRFANDLEFFDIPR